MVTMGTAETVTMLDNAYCDKCSNNMTILLTAHVYCNTFLLRKD